VLIINTGGTFNKVYDKIKGENVIEKNSKAIKEILSHMYHIEYELKEEILKDSLEFTTYDRDILYKLIEKSHYEKILIIHGTDTINITAEYLSIIKNKTIVLTGSMIPFSFDRVEASVNLSFAISSLLQLNYNKTYISIGGAVLPFMDLKKNKKLGIFR